MNKKKIFGGVLLVIIVAIAVGIYQWNKPHRKVEDEAGIQLTTDSLVRAYDGNEKRADSDFLNKTLSVKGTVSKVDTNQDGKTTVLFSSENPMSSVFCTMRDKNAKPDSGQMITIKGFCSGHTTDVLVTDCILIK